MTQLVYVADPMCSWCWGFAPVMRRLVNDAGYQVELVMGGLRAGESRGITPQLRDYVQHHWRQVAQTTGQRFRFEGALPDGFVYDTEPACRAVVVMRQLKPASCLAYLHELHAAFYAEAQDIKQVEVLASVAASQGIGTAEFQSTWESESSRLATEADFERKNQLGVMGFPCLLVDTGARLRIVAMGYQDYDTVVRQIQRRLKTGESNVLH